MTDHNEANMSIAKKIAYQVKEFYAVVGKKVSYWLPVLLITILSYGFSLFNRTVSIDDLAGDVYTGSGNAMIAANRWGMNLLSGMFSPSTYNTPFVDQYLGVIFLLAGAYLLCVILYILNGKRQDVWVYTVFSSALVSYPLINEIWGYGGAYELTCINLVLVSLAVLFQMASSKYSVKTVLTAGLLISPVMAGYESGVFTYITLVMMVLFLEYCVYPSQLNRKKWIVDGLKYASPLVLALLIRIVVGWLLISLYGVTYQSNGATGISWLSGDLSGIIEKMAWLVFIRYFMRGFVYLPIGVFVVCTVLFVIFSVRLSVKNRNIQPCIIGFLVMVSLFSQMILQGLVMPYRTAQTLQVFVPFVAYLFMTWDVSFKKISISKVRAVTTVLLMYVCVRQGMYLSGILALNNQRSDNEAAIIQNIGYELCSQYDVTKEVIFAGNISLGDMVESQVSINPRSIWYRIDWIRRKVDEKFVQSNVNSYINWSKSNWEDQIKLYFSYYGYDINVAKTTSEEEDQYYQTIAEENQMKPLEIRDMGEYILVYLGDAEGIKWE